jgi:AraC family transcriptional regulator
MSGMAQDRSGAAKSRLCFDRQAHTDHFGARVDCRPFLVEIPSNWLERTWSHGFVSSEPNRRDSIRIRGLLRQIYREYRAGDPTSSLAVEGLAWQLIAETARQAPRLKPRPRKLEMVREILHANFSDCPMLSDLAKLAAIHPTHLSRSFHTALRLHDQ